VIIVIIGRKGAQHKSSATDPSLQLYLIGNFRRTGWPVNAFTSRNIYLTVGVGKSPGPKREVKTVDLGAILAFIMQVRGRARHDSN
jgi:hypothetical protein